MHFISVYYLSIEDNLSLCMSCQIKLAQQKEHLTFNIIYMLTSAILQVGEIYVLLVWCVCSVSCCLVWMLYVLFVWVAFRFFLLLT